MKTLRCLFLACLSVIFLAGCADVGFAIKGMAQHYVVGWEMLVDQGKNPEKWKPKLLRRGESNPLTDCQKDPNCRINLNGNDKGES